ncbi:uncharacterized protein LOC111298438 [Durio zibethinus]|uniref:Uncharacterized protein LOC111298438 n=1 Tax=Durio zibethinus TaxID=66656 RepID=A0A6P5Z7Y8_DURZI|nr:uncharacterized protein LOC111298438 [Durio zibethinus]
MWRRRRVSMRDQSPTPRGLFHSLTLLHGDLGFNSQKLGLRCANRSVINSVYRRCDLTVILAFFWKPVYRRFWILPRWFSATCRRSLRWSCLTKKSIVHFLAVTTGSPSVPGRARTQYKNIVECAPSQHVPKHWSKTNGREGTMFKDPEYLEFLEFLAKPVGNLPSAEIHLERREAERAGVPKDAPVVTPLMDSVRQKRVAKGGSWRSLPNGKLSRRAGGSSGGSPSSASSKRGSEKRRGSTTMVLLWELKSLKRKVVWAIMHANSASDDKVVGNDLHGSEKPERRSRNKDRPDRGIWALCHSDGSYASYESSSSSATQSMQIPLYSSEYMGILNLWYYCSLGKLLSKEFSTDWN